MRITGADLVDDGVVAGEMATILHSEYTEHLIYSALWENSKDKAKTSYSKVQRVWGRFW